MSPIGTPLVGTYDYRVVAVSLLLAVITSYATLDIAGRLSAARGMARLAWLSGGAMAMGIGLWTSQFMGMEAFNLPVQVRFFGRQFCSRLSRELWLLQLLCSRQAAIP